jgi:cytochrome P450
VPASEGAPAVGFSALVGAYQDPHRLYDAARARDGVFYDAAGKCWLVTDHAAARTVLGDPRFTSELPGAPPSGGKPVPFVQAAIQRQILFTDGDQHLRVQQVILRESAQKMKEVLPTVRQRAHDLLEAGRARGRIDLVKEFAVPFTMEAICLVLGVPMGDRATMDQLTQWSTTYANVTSSSIA